MSTLLLAGVAFAYLLLLVFVAVLIETRPGRLRGWTTHPLTYTLALTIYDTGWAYFGFGSSLISSGVALLGQEIGWSFLFLCAWPLLVRVIRMAKAHHVSTIPDFFTLRYGGSPFFSVLISLLLLAALLPYIALQLKALALAYETLAGPAASSSSSPALGLTLALLLFGFALLFGARRADPTQRHEGLVAMAAISAIVKMTAVAAVAAFAVVHLSEVFSLPPEVWPDLRLGTTPGNSYVNWAGNFVLGLVSIVLLPHVFHITVIENSDERQMHLARWAWPLYGCVFRGFLLVIAMAGVWLGLQGTGLQTAILTLPLSAGHLPLTLLAYLGGIASATAMAIVALTALANTVMLDLILPALSRHTARLGPYLLPMRWGVMLAIALLAFGVWSGTQHSYLFQIGTLAFLAVALLAPPFFLGLVWVRPQRDAAVWAIALSAPVWLYTAFLPSFAGTSSAIAALVAQGPWGVAFLRPYALFGVVGLDPYVHSLFWSMLVNVGAFLVLALRHPSEGEEAQRVQDLLQGELAAPRPTHSFRRAVSYAEMESLLARFIGKERAEAEVTGLRRALEQTEQPEELRLLMARNELQRLLSGPLGTTTASWLIDEQFPISERTLLDVMDAYQKLEQMLSLNQEDLANRVRELSVLNAASERIVSVQEPDVLLCSIADLLAESFHFELVGAFLIDEGPPRLCCQLGFTVLGDGAIEIPEGAVLASALTERRLRILSAPLQVDPLDPLMGKEGLQTLVYVPLCLEDRLLGFLACGVKSSPIYLSADFQKLLQAIANEIAVALAAAQHRQREQLVRNQLEATLNNLADAVMLFAKDGRVVRVNVAMVALFEAPDERYFHGRPLAEILENLSVRDMAGHPLAAEETPTFRAVNAPGPRHLTAARIRTLKGRERILSISSTSIRDAAGEVVQVVTVYRDITELYELKEQLEQQVARRTTELRNERDRLSIAIEDLRSLDKVKGAFVNAISHDLRIPLTGIVGYAEFLDDELGGALSEQQHGFVAQILEASARMTRLLNDLLDFARLEAGKFKVELAPLDLPELLASSLDAFRPQLSKKKLAGRLELSPDLPPVLADPARLQQILANLLSNAVKFTPEGGAVTLRARAEGAWLVTEVSDTGVGIPAEALPHMFERFYQTEEGRRAGGTGLGLSITKSLLEAQGGWIAVSSAEGQGSTFRFGLPIAA